MRIQDLMTKTPFCCMETDTIQHAASLMKLHDVDSVPIVNNYKERKLLGIVTDRDICIRAVAADKGTSSVKVSDVMTSALHTCHVDDSVESCEALMERHQIRRVPVVDSHGICVGIVSQADIALRDSAEHSGHTVAAISKHTPHRKPAAA
jgi:CBS domain-containing protein